MHVRVLHVDAFCKDVPFACAQDLKLSLRVLLFFRKSFFGKLCESQWGSSVRTALFDQKKCFVTPLL